MEQFSKFAQSRRSRAKEIKALNSQVTELQQQLEKSYGELSIKSKTLKEIARQNEILSRELNESQNSVRNLKQQLEDEREFYLKQYAYHQAKLDGILAQSSSMGLLSQEELTAQAEKLTKAELSRVLINDQQEKLFLHRKIQKMETALAASTGTIYNLCVKFLRMKYLRDTLQEKLFEETEEHNIHVKNLNSLIEDLRNELENSVQFYHKNCKGECLQNNTMYLQVVTKNTRFMYENTVLQHQLRGQMASASSIASVVRFIT
ncbi:RUN and FYVE domain-containing protein 2 [Hetaerina americana]|uniref:RUN and FYVE domain-containing protein 2 n=1 Tax=Hetaerina americana TaxID=62018 RepID=UPI003A7F50D2